MIDQKIHKIWKTVPVSFNWWTADRMKGFDDWIKWLLFHIDAITFWTFTIFSQQDLSQKHICVPIPKTSAFKDHYCFQLFDEPKALCAMYFLRRQEKTIVIRYDIWAVMVGSQDVPITVQSLKQCELLCEVHCPAKLWLCKKKNSQDPFRIENTA